MGELLLDTLSGGLEGGLGELFNDVRPELRLRRGAPVGKPHAIGCLSVRGSDDFQTYDLIAEAEVETKRIGPKETVAIAVGCVDNLIRPAMSRSEA